MSFLVLVIICLMLRYQMARTLLVLGLVVYPLVLIGFAFMFGFGALYMFDLNPRLHWDDGTHEAPAYWVTQIVNGDVSLATLCLVPLLLPFDILRQMVWITLVRNHPVLWLTMLTGLYFSAVGWYTAIKAFVDGRREFFEEQRKRNATHG